MMNYVYNLMSIDNILNYLLYYKIKYQQSNFHKSIMDYFGKNKNISHAKLYNEDSYIDITDEFTNLTNMTNNENIIEWEKLLNIHDNILHLKNSEIFHLDIRYKTNDKYYRIMYKHNNDNNNDNTNIIKFPPYSDKEIQEYENADNYKKMVLSAEIDDKDITEIVKEYSGPLNNFYEDKDHKIHTHLIKNHDGEYIILIIYVTISIIYVTK